MRSPPPSVRIDVGAERGLAAVRFDLGEGADAVESVRIEIVHALGTTAVVVPPDAEQVELDLRTLPAGPAELRVTPLRSRGRKGRSGSSSFAVPGRAGTGPALGLSVRDRRVRRPRKSTTFVPRLLVAVQEVGAAASAIHLELRRPDGSVEFAHAPPPPGGKGEIRPFELDADAQAGKYEVRGAAVDVDGNAGPTARTSFAIGADGAAAPEITRATWRKGDRIVVRGLGFAAPRLVVLMDGVPLPVAEAEDRQLVAVGTNDLAGRLEVHTELGGAVAPAPVGPPASIEIGPEGATVAEGASAQLHAVVRGSTDATVEWSVDEAPSVEISADGLLTVGHEAPDVVVVRARNPATGAASSATVAVVAPQGRDLTIGPRGGTVRRPGGATLTVPAGALETPAKIDVRTRRPRLVQRDAVVAAEVTLAPADLAGTASLDVPLLVQAEPGSTVDVEHFEDGTWVPAGHGTVDTSGFTVHVDLARLPEAVRVKIPWPKPKGGAQALSAAPAIQMAQRTPIEEGDTVALLVTGENFVPGLTQVSVARSAGTVDTRIECRGTAVKADGTALGVTVEVGPLPDLGEGAISDHVLRVDTPAGRAEHPLPILGHDELIVGAGQTVTIPSSRRLSLLRVDAGGTLLVTSTVPPVTLDVLGEAFIDGAVTVVAATGSSGGTGVSGGVGGAGGAGAAPFAAAAGGAGGAGGVGDSAGMSGSTGSSLPGLVAGTAGAGGPSGGGGLHPHLGGDGAKGGTAPHRRITGFQAHSSPSPVLGLGAGGGGGGGGGGEGWVVKSTGGGGGGGGAGGGGVGIAAGQGIRLRGIVMANGGDGGNGGTAGAGPPGVFDYISAGQGGGGGGGGGGTIFLQGITDSWNAYALAVSGKPGATPSATVQIEARTALQQALARESTGDIRADGAIVGLARPVATQGPDVLYLDNLVATQPSLDVMGYNATHMRVTSGFGRTRRAITWSTNAGLNAETVLCLAPVPLAEGFNDIIAEWMFDTLGLPESSPLLDAQVLMVSTAVRTRKVLHLPGTIPFYDFAATIAPAAPTVATERAVDLTVTVTATQPTPLTWSVVGGTDFGTVAPQPNGARYRAPSRPLSSPATVVVASALSPTRTASVAVTVLPGITTSAVAATGRPAIASLPSANAGQVITIDIPAATYGLTNEGFTSVASVEFPVLRPKVGGGCERAIVPIAPVVATGLQSLTAEVPACADPGGWVRVPGHGSARLQIVPQVTQIDGDRAAEPEYTIRGTGFACGETQVLINGIPEPATSILSLSCGSIRMAQWPARGATLIVRTSGGDSAAFSVP